MAGATLAVGAYGASQQAKAGKAGANAQAQANAASIEEQRRQFDLSRQDQQPFMEAGYDALRRQNQALSGDFSGFQDSPDYAYALQQSLQGQERGAAARGGFMGGGADADRIALAQGLASQNFNNYWDRLAGRAGQGQGAAQNLAGYGASMAGNIGQNLQNTAAARASSYANSANAWGNFGNQALGAFGQYMGQRGSAPSQSNAMPSPYGGSLGPSNGYNWNFGGG